MDLKQQISEDMKNAMRAKEKMRLGTIRMLIAAIKQREIDERITMTDADVLSTINKMIKQRRESLEQYKNAERHDLAEKEQNEIDILETYLPQQLSETEIQNAVKKAIADTGASSMKDMGKLMGALKDELQGKADMSLVSKLVKDALG